MSITQKSMKHEIWEGTKTTGRVILASVIPVAILILQGSITEPKAIATALAVAILVGIENMIHRVRKAAAPQEKQRESFGPFQF